MNDDDFKSVMIDWLEDEDDEVRKHLVTPEEVQLLDPKYYYDCGYIDRTTRKNNCLCGNPVTNISYPMAFIRKAYINLKLKNKCLYGNPITNKETHILEVLKDKPLTLICSTASLRSMKEYTVGVREILDSFYQNTYVQAAGFSKPSLPRKFRFREDNHCCR
ncbi:hypothetical protein FRX31_014645, partial [Thalictrum thalictroides]